MREKSNNSGALIGLLGIAAVIASWFFVYIQMTALIKLVLWEQFLNFWRNSPRFDTVDTWSFLVIFIVPSVLALIAVPAFVRSSFFQARIPMWIGAIILLLAFVYRIFPVAENDLSRNVFRFMTDTGLVTVGPGFFLNLGGIILMFISAARAKG